MVAEIRAQGGELIVVTPQLPEHSQTLIAEHQLDFEILYDENYSLSDTLNLTHGFTDELKTVYQGFGIEVGKSNGTEEWKLPMPARFIIDGEGTILDVQVNPDYTRRPEPAEILTLLP